ncbi:hypothetical protein [Terriglobus roseus]|uniref:Uncharacterized protein n=1 Tax=Terriglobus roseus TaxID=392734 RepID=A0A1G7PCX1_9BACT|nr:hypothetical protein [Terriglobus roseus]SDF83967.1 hypothetical protein SAMN05444167_3459 [Terriglobus roseus]
MLTRIAAALLCTLSTAALAQAPSVSGQWNVHIDVMGNERDFSCKWTQEDKKLTGACGDMSDFVGSVDGSNVTWQAKGDQASLKFNGKLNSDGTITGTVNVIEYSVDGEFKATPVK